MEDQGWRFIDVGDLGRSEGQIDLGARRRPGTRDRSTESTSDRTVQMAARQQLDLVMSGQDLAQLPCSLEGFGVHERDAGGERRVVLEDDHRSRRVVVEDLVQPGQLSGVEPTTDATRHLGVEQDEAERTEVDDVVDRVLRSTCGQHGGEPPSEFGAIVVVAGHGDQRDRQGRQQLLEAVVLRGTTIVDEVTGGDHQVRSRCHGVEMPEHRRERRCTVDPIGHQRTRFDDVAIGDLSDEHDVTVARTRSPLSGPFDDGE